ncbi:MAG: NfeD family protein [Mycoplasmatales bacterium]|nr:NfeD family protein [Mycoplasmatales bacterium]
MEITMYIVWITIGIIAVIIETQTATQLGWAAALGSIGALITHGVTAGDPIWIEFAVFGTIWCFSWILLFLLIRPLSKKIHDKEDGYLNYIGQSYTAIKSNKNSFGELEINDKKFRFTSNQKIEKGDKVKVISIKGVTFSVEKEK